MSKTIRYVVVLSAIWVIAVIAVTAALWVRAVDTVGFTAENDVARSEDAVYVTDNGRKSGVLWRFDQDGQLTGFFTASQLRYLTGFRAKEVAVVNEEPQVVFQKVRDDGGRVVTEYCVLSLNADMEPTFITPPFRLPLELTLTGFSATEDVMYLTAVPENRGLAYVYEVPASEMKQINTTEITSQDVSKWKDAKVEVKENTVAGTDASRYIADAEYDTEELHVRYDNDLPEYFTIDTEARNYYNEKRMMPRQLLAMSGIKIPVYALIAFAGVGVIVLLAFMLRRRRRMVYAAVASELLLCLLFSAVFVYLVSSNNQMRQEEFMRFASADMQNVFDGYGLSDLTSDELYDEDAYSVVCRRLRRMTVDEEGGYLPEVTGAMVVTEEGTVILSGDGRNFQHVASLYGNDVEKVARNSIQTASVSYLSCVHNGDTTLFLAMPLVNAGYNGFAGLIVAELPEPSEHFMVEYGKMLSVCLAAFVIVSIVLLVFFLRLDGELGRLQKAMEMLADGASEIKKPAMAGTDMNNIWNSIIEIQKNILHTNRVKLLIYEAYYRFAPKSVERILDRQSITEVAFGDSARRQGTIAHISSDRQLIQDEVSMEEFNHRMQLLENCQKEHDGIFISHDSSLSTLKLLFLNNNQKTISFGVDFLFKLREEGKKAYSDYTMILHYTPFVYAVIGSDEQANVYMSMPHEELLQRYAEWFHSMHLGLIITETVLEHEKIDAEYRYIGFIVPDETKTEERLKLYEVLDAESVRVHKDRLETQNQFREALGLFYQQDFYFARNIFTDIIKTAYDDELAKWYLFECERYLNEAAPENFVGELHMENSR